MEESFFGGRVFERMRDDVVLFERVLAGKKILEVWHCINDLIAKFTLEIAVKQKHNHSSETKLEEEINHNFLSDLFALFKRKS